MLLDLQFIKANFTYIGSTFILAMNSLWEAAKRSPFLNSANCEAKMSTDNQLVANRTIAAAAAGKDFTDFL